MIYTESKEQSGGRGEGAKKRILPKYRAGVINNCVETHRNTSEPFQRIPLLITFFFSARVAGTVKRALA